MNIARLAKVMVATAVALVASACATTTTSVPDRTPKWMKYQVLGSRIHRKVDASGQPDSANYVMNVEADDLATLPAVTVSTRRR